jgi:hypothetical protein
MLKVELNGSFWVQYFRLMLPIARLTLRSFMDMVFASAFLITTIIEAGFGVHKASQTDGLG